MAGVQLRYETGLTGERYVTAGAWRRVRLERCPNHPRGGCSLARHGTYERKTPPGTRVARWYCPESHTTFSLLPDCLAARLPGTLDALEAVVVAAEGARSLEAAANELRRDAVELPGAMRWVRRGGASTGATGRTGAGILMRCLSASTASHITCGARSIMTGSCSRLLPRSGGIAGLRSSF